MKKRALLLVKVAVSIGLLGWVVHAALARDGIDALGARLAGLSWPLLSVAIAVQLAAVFAGVARWRELLGSQGLPLPFPWLARAYLIGRFAGTFTPSTAGLDVYRAIAVARHTGETARAGATIAIEKVVGLLGLSIACVLLLPLGGTRFFGPSAIAIAMAIGVASALVLALLRSGVLARVRTLSRLHLSRVPGRVLARTIALSLASHLLTSAVFAVAAAALGLAVSPLAVLVVGNAIVVATLVPVSVGGVGVREGVAVALLGTVGVSALDATLVALLGYLVGQVPGIMGFALTFGGATVRAPGTIVQATPEAP